MDDAIILQELETLAYQLAIEVRYDALDGPGGLCRLKGRDHLILDRDLTVPERIAAIGRALAQVPLDDVFIRPRIREVIDAYAGPYPHE